MNPRFVARDLCFRPLPVFHRVTIFSSALLVKLVRTASNFVFNWIAEFGSGSCSTAVSCSWGWHVEEMLLGKVLKYLKSKPMLNQCLVWCNGDVKSVAGLGGFGRGGAVVIVPGERRGDAVCRSTFAAPFSQSGQGRRRLARRLIGRVTDEDSVPR